MIPLIFALLAIAPPADTTALVESVIAHEKAELPKRQQYTFREDIVKRHFDKNGKEGSTVRETFEVLFLEGAPYRKLIAENDKPLAAAKQTKVEKEMALEKLRRVSEKRGGMFHRVVKLGGIAMLPTFYDVTAKEESLQGRAVWKLDAQPRSGVPTETEAQRNAAGTRRSYWIDPEEKTILKEETEFLVALNGVQPGTVFTAEYQKVNSDCWLPVRNTFKWSVVMAKFVKGRGINETTFSGFKKFDVDSSVVFDVEK